MHKVSIDPQLSEPLFSQAMIKVNKYTIRIIEAHTLIEHTGILEIL